MDRGTFETEVSRARKAHPTWFDLPPDACPDDAQVEQCQLALGAVLPEAYVGFLREYGGGDFAFLTLYSMDPDSEVNLVAQNNRPWLARTDFVAVSDNGAGDYYGFRVRDGRCAEPVVLLDHETGEVRDTGYADILTFVLGVGLRITQ